MKKSTFKTPRILYEGKSDLSTYHPSLLKDVILKYDRAILNEQFNKSTLLVKKQYPNMVDTRMCTLRTFSRYCAVY